MTGLRRFSAFGLLASLAFSLLTAPARADFRRVGVWLTNSPSRLYYDQQRIERAVQQLDAAGFNTSTPMCGAGAPPSTAAAGHRWSPNCSAMPLSWIPSAA